MQPLLILAQEIGGGLVEAQEGRELVLDLLALRVLGDGPAVGLLLHVEVIYLCRDRKVEMRARMEGCRENKGKPKMDGTQSLRTFYSQCCPLEVRCVMAHRALMGDPTGLVSVSF